MDFKQQVQDQFGKNAHHYVTSEIHAKGNDLAAMVVIAETDKTMSVLDIATGGGHVANAFAPLVGNVVALDLTENMLKKAEEFIVGNSHTNVQFVQGDAESLPFEDGSFDIVTCRIAPHHFPNVASFVSESYRVLKNGGVFLLIDNVAPEKADFEVFYNAIEKKRDYSHYRALKKTEWISLLEHTGFTTQQLLTFPKQFSFQPWCDRMALPDKEKNELEQFIMSASQDIHDHFSITIRDGQLVSFQAQSILVKSRKR